MYDCITTYESVHSGLNVFDHVPIGVEFSIQAPRYDSLSSPRATLKWHTASAADIDIYKANLSALISEIDMPVPFFSATHYTVRPIII